MPKIGSSLLPWCVALLVAVTGAGPAAASDGDGWPFVAVTCDAAAASVRIQESIADSEAAIPVGANVRSLDKMLRQSSLGENDALMSVASRLVRQCRFGSNVYRVTVKPSNAHPRVQGMCGAGAPTAVLSVSRNGHPLLARLLFRITCIPDGDIDNRIEAVTLFDRREAAVFELADATEKSQATLEFSRLGALNRDSLFVRAPAR